MNLESLTVLIPIVIAIVSAFSIQPLFQIFDTLHRKKLKKILYASESTKLFETYDTDFKKDFILPDLKESYFYIQTGIKTNEKSIDKYIQFKNELSGNYTWEDIKLVKNLLNLNGEKIEIQLSKRRKFFSNVIFGIALLLFLSVYFIFIKFSPDFSLFSDNDIIKFMFLIVIPVFIGCFLIYLIGPIITAKGMEKKLKNAPKS